MKVKSITYQLLSRCIDAVVCTECIKSSALPDLTEPNQTKPNAWCLASSIATTLYHTLVHCYSFFSFIIAFKTLLVVLSITFDLSSSWIFYLFFFDVFLFLLVFFERFQSLQKGSFLFYCAATFPLILFWMQNIQNPCLISHLELLLSLAFSFFQLFDSKNNSQRENKITNSPSNLKHILKTVFIKMKM